MNTEKLQQIIEDKNAQKERDAIHEAECIINAIVEKQQVITRAEASIKDLRADLQKLEVEQLDSKTVLGE